ncbi:MAG: electron transfer flavoprotein subunit beta/FixA family protein [Candidatus Omnitrophica bacterium]|nr:electron transfer flavoprotein subunit beta/FixA family protein [Candidatus Omnitrophota bacterium]
MNIVVCIKQVPDTTDVKINPETNTLVRDGVASIINPFDMYAIEEALRIKEKVGGTITAITMGPPQAENALREAISLGVDDVILLSDRAFAGSDTWATSYTLAQGIKKLGKFDIILCGKQAIDGDTAQVGPGIAVQLDIPQIMFVKHIREINDTKIIAERMTEEGAEVIESSLPVMVSVVKEINTPRLPSLKGKMRSKKAEVIKWTAADLDVEEDCIGLNGSPTVVNKIFTPPQRSSGVVFEGEPEETVKKLYEAIKPVLGG